MKSYHIAIYNSPPFWPVVSIIILSEEITPQLVILDAMPLLIKELKNKGIASNDDMKIAVTQLKF